MTSVGKLGALAEHSVKVILGNQGPGGGYPASPSFPTYRYSWFRDGAFIAEAMSRLGHPKSAEAFFGWCTRVLVDQRDKVESLVEAAGSGAVIGIDDHLHARYTLGGIASMEPWTNFQLDGYGTWLWSLDMHSRRHDADRAEYLPAVALTVRYLAAFWDQPSFDWWEENSEYRHTSTLAAIWGGLNAAAGFGDLDPETRQLAGATASDVAETVSSQGVQGGRLTKWLDGDGLDASLVACATPFRLFDPDHPTIRATVIAIEAELVRDGVYRYSTDTYYGGGEWVLLAGLLGWHYSETGDRESAWRLLEWMAEQADENLDLPEQVDRSLLFPERKAEWVERWGAHARPLLWSHAMYLILAQELGVIEADGARR